MAAVRGLRYGGPFQWSVTRGLPRGGAYSYGVPKKPDAMAKINQDLCILTTILVFTLATGGAIMKAQDGAMRHCKDLGPLRCQVAAIRAW